MKSNTWTEKELHLTNENYKILEEEASNKDITPEKLSKLLIQKSETVETADIELEGNSLKSLQVILKDSTLDQIRGASEEDVDLEKELDARLARSLTQIGGDL